MPTEGEEQRMLFEWAKWACGAHPELALMYHIPNEGKRTGATGGRLVAEGMRKGVPDICLPVARSGYHALYIELKRRKGGVVSEEQRGWIAALNRAGNKAVVAKGWMEAEKVITEYLRGDK